MRIALVSSALLGYGGMETVFQKVMSYYNSRNFMDLILTDGVKNKSWIKRFSKNSIFYHEHKNKLSEFIFLLKILKKNKYDIVIATSKKTLIFCSWIRKLLFLKFKLVSWIHFSLTNEGMPVNLKKYGDYHIAVSLGNKNEMLKMGVASEKIFLLYNPITLGKKICKISKLNNFIYIGRIEFQGAKNFKELIDFITGLRSKWKIDIYGSGEINKCKLYIDNNYPNLKNNFIWHGWSNDPWNNITSSKALILTSKTECFPMVFLESLSHGIPCLSSNYPGDPRSIIIPGINGEIYKCGSKKDFLKKINHIISVKYDPQKVRNTVLKYNDRQYFKQFTEMLYKIYK